MAKVYADQGNLEKATEIYKYLLECEPGRQDLVDALSNIEKNRLEKNLDHLQRLLGRWVDLLLAYNRMQKLKKLKNALGD
jgi:tetratricopeptide (TPR) repeat protein